MQCSTYVARAILLATSFFLAHEQSLAQDLRSVDEASRNLLYWFQDTANPAVDPHQTVGFQTCANCHKSEAAVWRTTWHYASFKSLHRTEEAKRIANRLGLDSVKYSQRCIACHYTEVAELGSVNAAVSCELCHGAGKKWYFNHFPLDKTIAETELQRQTRILGNLAKGMRNRHNTYSMSRICMRCHNPADEELVNMGGHPPVSPDFEMVAWSQGLMRHRFVSGGGTRNAPNSLERLSVMFVSGIIADLEFSLRATANATQKAEFGVQAASRALRAAKRLNSVQTKVELVILEQILDEFRAVELKINRHDQLIGAAEKIKSLGIRFAAETELSDLQPIVPFVPQEAAWRWE